MKRPINHPLGGGSHLLLALSNCESRVLCASGTTLEHGLIGCGTDRYGTPALAVCNLSSCVPPPEPASDPALAVEVKVTIFAAAFVLLLLLLTYCCGSKNDNLPSDPHGVLRESFLGTGKTPEALLVPLNLPARWTAAQQTPVGNAGAPKHRKLKGKAAQLAIMFTDDHLGELRPLAWRDCPLGKGSYGTVFKAVWRGEPVAVKVINDLPKLRSETAKSKTAEIVTAFVQECEVACDVYHTNIVRLLGYSTKPELVIVMEQLHTAMDTQLYKEDWVPTLEQLLHVSLGIADGMCYLHTAFDKPLIHRDLKSPNVLFTASPSDRDCVAKITDFGLARDKADDDNMTGCGSVL